MKIERYYYSEAKRKWDRIRENWQNGGKKRQGEESLQIFECGQPEESREDNTDMSPVLARLSESLSGKMIDQKKSEEFQELVTLSAVLAKEIRANLQICVEDLTGSIIFAGEEMNYTGRAKALFEKASAAADEVHIRVSSDTGEGSAIDIEGLVQIEYWFDFYTGPENFE